MSLSVVLSNTAGVPIYEQIAQQVRDAILTGQVEADEMLPSIRALARGPACQRHHHHPRLLRPRH